MAPAEFSLRLQRGTLSFLEHPGHDLMIGSTFVGITGGFAPPTPSAVYTVTASPQQSAYAITSQIRPDGTPTLQDALPKSLAPTSETSALVDELEGILRTIPTEIPVGSQDIYGMDVGLAYGSANLEWFNGGPAGCGVGESSVQASAEDKKKFARAVEIVEELVAKAK